jgi:imidazolonepropionase
VPQFSLPLAGRAAAAGRGCRGLRASILVLSLEVLMPLTVDTLWTNARIATMAAGRPGLGQIEDGAIAAKDGRIAFAGLRTDLPSGVNATDTIDCDGRWITPGLVDCHTHLVYAGNRAPEFEQRLSGISYEEIARAGGGIASTVRATRTASELDLVTSALPRLDRLLADGVTTVEIKSGYGLDLPTERRLLSAARRLGRMRDVGVTTTFLGAHALPPEAMGDKDAYIDEVVAMLPVLAGEGLVDAVDGFCEGIAFSPAQMARVFDAAKALNLPVKLHAEQLSNLGGAAMAAGYGAHSADHLEYLDEAGIVAMKASGTVAVLLPGAFYFIRETKLPPVHLLRRHGVPIALATDCNPGTSPLTSLLLTLNMGATLFRMTVEECLLAVTRHGAAALGQGGDIGTLEAGKSCDLAIWSVDHLSELVYAMGAMPLRARIWRGK